MNKPSRPILALAETEEDVMGALSHISAKGVEASHIEWLALGVDAHIALNEKGLKARLPSDLISPNDKRNIFIDSMEWSKHWLDGLKIDDSKIIFGTGSTLSLLVKDGMHMYFGYLFYMISVLEKAAAKFAPSAFLFCDLGPKEVRGIDHTNEYYLGRVASRVASKYGIGISQIDHGSVYAKKTEKNKLERFFFHKISRAIFKMLSYDSLCKKIEPLDQRTVSIFDHKRVLVLGAGKSSPFWGVKALNDYLKKYNDQLLRPLFYAKDNYLGEDDGVYLSKDREYLQRSSSFMEKQEYISRFLADGRFLDNLYYLDIDISDLCCAKLLWILKVYLPKYWLDYLSLNEELKRSRYDMAIGATPTSGDTGMYSALHCFKNACIPSLYIPHGVQFRKHKGSCELENAINLYCLNDYTHTATAGEYVRDSFLSCGEEENNSRCTGSISYHKIGKIGWTRKKILTMLLGLSPSKKKMIYFLSRLTRGTHENYTSTTFDDAANLICDIVKVADKLGYELIIKAHPAFLNAKRWLDSLDLGGRYKIVTAVDANKVLLSIADVVIITRSSIAVKSLDYGNAVIIFDHEKDDLFPFEDLSAPVHLYGRDSRRPYIRATGYEELFEACKKIMHDTDFLKAVKKQISASDPWVHHNNDGQQVKRVAEFMADITKNVG